MRFLHDQSLNSGTSAVCQEEQFGICWTRGINLTFLPESRQNTQGYYVFTAILDNFHLPLCIDFSAFSLLYFLTGFQNGNYHCDIRCYRQCISMVQLVPCPAECSCSMHSPVIHISYTDIREALPIHMYAHGLRKLIMPYITCTQNVKCTSK